MRRWNLVTVVVGMLAVVWYAQAGGNSDNPPGFGKKIAGSYLLIAAQEGNPAIPFLATLDADGTFISTDATDFGAGIPNFGFESSQHGAWKRTGSHQIQIKALWMNYDEDGAITTIGVQTSVVEVSDDFTASSGTFTLDFYTPDQNPLDPDAVPVFSTGGTITGQRIEP